MSTGENEIEVKFFMQNLVSFEDKLKQLQTKVIQPRTHEINLRFDTPEKSLSKSQQVLRLRRDTKNTVTYKGPGSSEGGVMTRREIEFGVNDFDSTQKLFEVLGFQVLMMYEKYRAVYQLSDVLITLDEMPYGDFIELEGPDAQSIIQISQELNLNWDKRILSSYSAIFEQLCKVSGFSFRDLSFENFRDQVFDLAQIHIQPAD